MSKQAGSAHLANSLWFLYPDSSRASLCSRLAYCRWRRSIAEPFKAKIYCQTFAEETKRLIKINQRVVWEVAVEQERGMHRAEGVNITNPTTVKTYTNHQENIHRCYNIPQLSDGSPLLSPTGLRARSIDFPEKQVIVSDLDLNSSTFSTCCRSSMNLSFSSSFLSFKSLVIIFGTW